MKYTKNEKVKKWHDQSDKDLYDEFMGIVCEYGDVERVDGLVVVMDSFFGNKEFEKFFNHCEYGDEDEFDFDFKLIPFLNALNDSFTLFYCFPLNHLSFRHKFVINRGLIALCGIIQLAFVHYNNHFLTTEEDKVIKTSNIFYYLTFFVEDYDNPSNEFVEYGYDYYKDYFKRLKKINWADKTVKRLKKAINNWLLTIVGMYDVNYEVLKLFQYSVDFLIACCAFKEGHDAVFCEDVVVGYLTCFKMIFNDIRPVVYSLYDKYTWGVVDGDIKEYKYLDKSPFDNV